MQIRPFRQITPRKQRPVSQQIVPRTDIIYNVPIRASAVYKEVFHTQFVRLLMHLLNCSLCPSSYPFIHKPFVYCANVVVRRCPLPMFMLGGACCQCCCQEMPAANVVVGRCLLPMLLLGGVCCQCCCQEVPAAIVVVRRCLLSRHSLIFMY